MENKTLKGLASIVASLAIATGIGCSCQQSKQTTPSPVESIQVEKAERGLNIQVTDNDGIAQVFLYRNGSKLEKEYNPETNIAYKMMDSFGTSKGINFIYDSDRDGFRAGDILTVELIDKNGNHSRKDYQIK